MSDEHKYIFIEHVDPKHPELLRGNLIEPLSNEGVIDSIQIEGDAEEVVEHFKLYHPTIRHLELVDNNGDVIENHTLSVAELAQIELDNVLAAIEGPHSRNE